MRVYRFENGTIPVPAREADHGPYRLRNGEDAVWPPTNRAYGGPAVKPWRRIIEAALAVTRLIVPVFLLLTLLGAAYLYADALLPDGMLPAPADDAALTVSDLILPLTWTVIHLTNRRYGPAYALAQLLAALTLAGVVALVNPSDIDNWLPFIPSLSWRAMLAFSGAFLVANFIAIVFFDGARGPRWWTAPLVASAAASFVFSGIYYPAAFAGVGGWTQTAMVHFALFFGESILLLFPYYLLRPTMRPLPGLNGY